MITDCWAKEKYEGSRFSQTTPCGQEGQSFTFLQSIEFNRICYNPKPCLKYYPKQLIAFP